MSFSICLFTVAPFISAYIPFAAIQELYLILNKSGKCDLCAQEETE